MIETCFHIFRSASFEGESKEYSNQVEGLAAQKVKLTKKVEELQSQLSQVRWRRGTDFNSLCAKFFRRNSLHEKLSWPLVQSD